MVKSKSSKHVEASGSGIDRISNLPEPLLSHILSLLPTKCAVSTSVLSTRWKFLWTSISNLDFCSLEFDPQLYSTSTLEKKLNLQWKSNQFTLFVNRVLRLLNPSSVQNFRLKCYQDCFDLSYLMLWISEGFGRTFREFELSLTMRGRMVLLPLSHVYCNVVVLKLDGDIYFNIPAAAASLCFPSVQTLHLHKVISEIASNDSVTFPNLKFMRLSYVKFVNNDTIHNLFSSCPILDDLIIERDGYDDLWCLIICIPSLTRLSIKCHTIYSDTMDKVQIDSPALKYLNLTGGSYYVYVRAGNLSSLLHANVKVVFFDDFNEDNVNVECSIKVIKFIRSLSNVKFLSVSDDVVKAFRSASVNTSEGFHNLTRLEIQFANCLDFSVIINKFLENMNNLEHLVIKGWGFSCSRQWTEPLNVPKCLLSRVTTVSFSYMRNDCCDQLELLRYFLENAEVLQLLTICSGPSIVGEKQLEMIEKISLIHRVSRACQIEFT